jgi:hypothetical protein
MGKAPESITLDNGALATRDFQAEHSGSRRAGGECWPMKPCYASGVNASQAGELRKHLADRGCPTVVTSEGDPIYTSPGHRTKALRIRGMHDNKGFN